jgi:hypothetical protein
MEFLPYPCDNLWIAPFMPGWTFSPAIQDMQRWNGFSDTDVSSIAHQNAELLYPALAGRLQQSKAA